jgi:hypothetical protein
MTKSNTSLLIFFLLAPLFGAFGQLTERHYLSGKDAGSTVVWDFFCTDGRNSGEWTKIQVPSNWELQGFGTYNYGHDWKDEQKELGREHGLYKHTFEADHSWKGKHIRIVFDGAMTDTKVSINGKVAGEMHQGGFNRFSYDVTKLLKFGKENLLEVDVAKHSTNESINRAERQADFWIFGGIYRPVFLEIYPEDYIKRVAIDAKANGRFAVMAELCAANIADHVQVELFDMRGEKLEGIFKSPLKKDAASVSVAGRFEGVKSWNPEMPVLYDMRVSLMKKGRAIHIETKRIGFRTVELRAHDGFYVNGKKVVFKGVNRHSFWPETGRALSEENHLVDIRLMKEMNMNAARMSHYCPDERFLELCDSLGLFVLDELAGWQDGYDTIVGPKLVKELILKDENHPSVIIWDHGNEGGWDFANEKWFHLYDIQKRPVIYPWLNRNDVDTHHYNAYDFGINRYYYGNDVFMPTELLHGLYDGGHGAGLFDYWNRFTANPRAAGGFLWVFCDEAVLRTDQGGTVFDSNGSDAPDGILGPHREKEASFYTIKELWSPVQIAPVVISPSWDGQLLVRNDYIYSNLNTVKLRWKALKTSSPGETAKSVVLSGTIDGPDAQPGETGLVKLDLKRGFKEADVFVLTATAPGGSEICTWSWPIQHPKTIVNRIINEKVVVQQEILIEESGDFLTANVGGIRVVFDLSNGQLTSVENPNGKISLSGGPKPLGVQSTLQEVSWDWDEDRNLALNGSYDNFPSYFIWSVHRNGLVELEASPNLKTVKDIDYLGIGFDYPEEKVKSMRWLGDGPYRVWKNRIHGVNFNVWEKDYNNTITGESFNNLVYPEFKGYHANVNWVRLETTESAFDILVETPNIFTQVFTPESPQQNRGGTVPPFPDADISFLFEIPAIGTKFKQATELGPSSQKGIDRHYKGDDNDAIRVWFDFSADK